MKSKEEKDIRREELKQLKSTKQLRGYKFRCYPNKQQEELFKQGFYAEAVVYNKLLGGYVNFRRELNLIPGFTRDEIFKYYTKTKGIDKNIKNSFYFEYYKSTDGKAYNFYSDFDTKSELLNQIPASVMDNCIGTVKKAFANMFKTNAGFPRFKKINHDTKEVLTPNGNSFTLRYLRGNQTKTFKISDDRTGFVYVSIPWTANIKVGKLKIKKHRGLPLNYNIKSATISKTKNNQWYISFITEFDKVDYYPTKERVEIIGVDRNCKHNVVCTSDEGLNIENELLFSKDEHLKLLTKKLIGWQRKYSTTRENLLIKFYGKDKQNKTLSQEQKSSKLKTYEKIITNCNLKIKKYREYKNWNIANKLTDYAETIIFEDLNLKGMTKRAKDKGKQDGTVARKSGLNKSMLSASLYDIKLKTEIKSKEKNCFVYDIPARNTSLRCNDCGHTHKDNRKTQSKFVCISCGSTSNADLNAGKNIRDKHLELW